MKVLLIRHHEKPPNGKGKYKKNIFSFPPLGIAYLAAILKKNNFNVEILDSYALNLNEKQIKDYLSRSKADIFGITAITHTLPGVYDIGRILKELVPDSLKIIGGPHMMTYPKETMEKEFFDIGVIGEGEKTLLEIVDKYSRNENITNIQGTINRLDNKIKINPSRAFINDLDEIPFPARELLPINIYKSVDGLQPLTTMITSRGCPYQCAMCHKGIWGNKLRFRSAENVVEEIKECIENYKIKEIYMYDDTFTVDKKRTLMICKKIKEENLNFTWDIVTRVNTVDQEIINALHNAGCRKIRFGVESGVQTILDKMKKGITLDQARKAFNICQKIGIETQGYFMIGYPGETKETIEKTIKFAKELNPRWASFSITTAYPYTKLFEDISQYKSIDPDFWRNYTLGDFSRKFPYFTNDELSEKVLKNYIKKANWEFYLRPSAIFQRFCNMKSFSELSKQYSLFLNEFRKGVF